MPYIAQERVAGLPDVIRNARILSTCEVFRPSTKEELEKTSKVSQRIAIGVIVKKNGKQYALWFDAEAGEFMFAEHPRYSYND